MKKKYILNLFSILIFISTTITAQSTGKIMGKVTDQATGEGIPFANVFIEGASKGAASDIDGNFVILNVTPDVYTVTASYIGYQKVTKNKCKGKCWLYNRHRFFIAFRSY